MSDANRVLLSYVEEVTYGVTPTTPTLTDQRYTGETLKPEPTYVVSPEIDSSRQVTDRIRTGFRASGDVGFALSYGAEDNFFRYSLLSAAYTTPVTATITSTVTVPGGVFTITRSSGDFTTGVYSVGKWVKITGHATAGNNGYGKLLSVSALVITVGQFTGTPSAEGPTTNVVVAQGAEILGGTTMLSISAEKAYQDLSNVFEQGTGFMFEGFDFDTAAGGLVQGQFHLIGQDLGPGTASLQASGSHTAAPTNPIYNAVDNAIAVFEGGARMTMKSVGISYKNNLRERLVLGTLGPVSIGAGSIDAEIRGQGYFDSQAQLTKMLANTPSSCALVFAETAVTNAMVFEGVRGKFTAYNANASALNTDVALNWTLGLYKHPTEAQTFRITRWA